MIEKARLFGVLALAVLLPSGVARAQWIALPEVPWQAELSFVPPTHYFQPTADSSKPLTSHYQSPAPALRRLERYYFMSDETGRPLGPVPMAADPVDEKLVSVPGGIVVREFHYFDAATDRAMQPLKKEAEPAKEAEPKKLTLPDPADALKEKAPVISPPQSSTETKPEATRSLYPPLAVPSANGDAKPIKVSGIFRSARGGSLISNAKLGFYDAQGKEGDTNTETDAFGRFSAQLPLGTWQVYLMLPAGGRRYLQNVQIEAGENSVLSIDG